MAETLPDDLPFKTPPDLASRQQTRFAFDRLGKRLDTVWDALGILNSAALTAAPGGAINVSTTNEISVTLGDGLHLDTGAIAVAALEPLTVTTGVLQILYGDGITVTSNLLVVDAGDGLTFNAGALVVNAGSGLAFDTGALVVDLGGSTTTTTLSGNYLVMTTAAGVLSKVVAPDIWFLSYGSPSGLSQNSYTYVPLPFSTYTAPSGSVSRVQWNTIHQPEINAIFLAIIAYIDSVKATLNANINALATKGL